MVKPELYDDAVRLYKESQAQLTEANTKNSDLEGKLANAVSPTVYDDAVRLYKESQAQLTEANTKNSDLEGKLANAVSPTVYDETVRLYKESQAQLTEANTKNLELEGKLASVVSQSLYDETVQNYRQKKAELTAANTKSLELEANIASMRAQLADKDKQLLTLQTQAAAAVIKPQQRLTQSGKDPYDPSTVIGKKYYDDMMETIRLTCNPHPDQKYVKTSCILAEVDAQIKYRGE
jgi:hypothetical protein